MREAIESLAKNFGSIDLLTACIMRNNGVSYEVASNIAERLNGSDYIFDRFIENYLDDEEE